MRGGGGTCLICAKVMCRVCEGHSVIHITAVELWMICHKKCRVDGEYGMLCGMKTADCVLLSLAIARRICVASMQ